MFFKSIIISISILFSLALAGCTIKRNTDEKISIITGPYLQTATPTSIYIMWETSKAGNSLVEWGTTPDLGRKTSGFNIEGKSILDQYSEIIPRAYPESVIHHVQLTDLTPDTLYYYKVVTEHVSSETYSFRSPPTEDSEKSFTFIVFGDNRRTYPDNTYKIIDEGMIIYVQSEISNNDTLPDKLAMVWSTGDIVTHGASYDEYKNEWFDPVHNISSQVPFYVAIGNHEYSFSDPNEVLPNIKNEENAEAYFAYLELPGDENKYSFNYSNSHFIALNTNGPGSDDMGSYGGGFEAQLEWLEKDLIEATANETIDFIFSFHHHPYKTELFNQGESAGCTARVGEFVKFYEQYGVNAFFSGHTHAMERGNSREEPVYWVLSGGGGSSLANWLGPATGERVSFDHPEIQKAFDENGFHVVTVTAGDNPEFSVKYISLGDLDNEEFKNNAVIDEFTFKKIDSAPEKPNAVYPLSSDNPSFEDILFQASDFADPDLAQDPETGLWQGDYHHETQWQITTESGNYPDPEPVAAYPPALPFPTAPMVVDRWVRYENFYGETKPIEEETILPGIPIDTQDGDDLTNEIIGLESNITYYWRVRYRDGIGLKWSEWSDEAMFTTAP